MFALLDYVAQAVYEGKDLHEDEVEKLLLEADEMLEQATECAERCLCDKENTGNDKASKVSNGPEVSYVSLQYDSFDYDSDGHTHLVEYEYHDDCVREPEITNHVIHMIAIYFVMRTTKKLYFEVREEEFKWREEWWKQKEQKEDEQKEEEWWKQKEQKEDEQKEKEWKKDWEQQVAIVEATIKHFDEQRQGT